MQFNTTLTRQIVLLFTLLFSVTSARNVQFSVVSFGKNVKVKIGNKNYDLKKVNNTPLFKASISVNNNAISYQYIEDNKTEAFSRTLSKDKTKTDNDFYGRKDTVKKLPQFPTLYKWNRSVGKGELFDDSYIPTVYISGTNSQTFFTSKKPKKSTLENVVFILKNNVYTFSNVQSVAKNYAWDKFQFKVSLPNNGIQGRYILKFRDNNEDPTFMRQDLYGDILNAVGCPTIQSVKTRVYVNNQPVGYYILQEEAASNSFIRSAFYGDNNGKYLVTKTKDLGYALDGHTGSDFYYTGSNIYNYFIPDTGKSDDRVRLTAFLKAFEKLNYKNNNEVKQFEKDWFDIETFLRAMAMEYLTAHYDSYWFLTSNFVLYDDPKESKNGKYKFYFIDQDWDGTFGLNADAYCLRYPDYIKHSYKDYVNKKWGEQDDSPKRFAIDTLLSNAQIKKRFEKILTDIVINIFNPVAISKRLDALVERHREEVKWNYDVINSRKLRKGNPPLRWSMTDFEKNIEGPTSNGAKYGIKQFVYLRAKAIKEEFGINVNLGNKKYNDINTSGRCGPEFGECPAGQCCSQHGYCGTSSDYCNNCQSEFGKCDKKNIKITTTVKKTTTTVKKTTTTVKKTTTTKANVKKTTTTKANVKKTTTTKANVKKTTTTKANVKKTTTTKANVKKTTTTKAQTKGNTNNQKISTDGTCGAASGRCPDGYCCSQYGYCGNMKEYCGVGCQKAYGICN